jgi:hypothetical protein
LWPQHQRGTLVAALERGTLVAGGLFEVLLIGVHALQRIARADLGIGEGQDAQCRSAVVGAAPVRQGQ